MFWELIFFSSSILQGRSFLILGFIIFFNFFSICLSRFHHLDHKFSRLAWFDSGFFFQDFFFNLIFVTFHPSAFDYFGFVLCNLFLFFYWVISFACSRSKTLVSLLVVFFFNFIPLCLIYLEMDFDFFFAFYWVILDSWFG
jgi:hypothetical protein